MAITANGGSDFEKLATAGAKSDPQTQNQNNIKPQVQPQPEYQPQANPTAGYQPQVSAQTAGFQAQPENNPWAQFTGTGLLTNLNGLDVPYNTASSRVSSFHTAFTEVANNITQLMQHQNYWDLLIFDGSQHQATASALLFARRDPANHTATVYAFLIQDANTQLPDKQHNTFFNGQQITINLPQLTEELITADDYIATRIVNYVAKTYANRDVSEVFFAGGRVLQKELEPTNKQQIARCLFYANYATQTFLADLAGVQSELSLAAKRNDESIRIKVDFNAGLVADAVGRPERSDINIRTLVQRNVQGGRVHQSLGQVENKFLSSVSAFLTFAHNPQQTPVMPQYYGQPVLHQSWLPSIVITSLDNQFDRASLSTQLLALASSAVMTRTNFLMEALRPNYAITQPGEDPRDIGNLTTIENYPGEQLGFTDTKSKDFNLGDFIQRHLQPSLKFYLDVEEAGDLTYIQRPFIEAAGAGVDSKVQQQANAMILEAAQILTAGHFAEEWKQHNGEQFFYSEVGRIELGDWVDQQGNVRDLREIDTLSAIVRMGPEKANEFIDSFNFSIYPDEMLRFNIRRELYDAYFTGYTIRGFARRLTVNPNFLQALLRAVEKASPNITTDQQWYSGNQINRGYQNQILGVPLNSITAFNHGGYVAANGQVVNNQWRQFQAFPNVSVHRGMGTPYTPGR